jgi:hypothetical protein
MTARCLLTYPQTRHCNRGNARWCLGQSPMPERCLLTYPQTRHRIRGNARWCLGQSPMPEHCLLTYPQTRHRICGNVSLCHVSLPQLQRELGRNSGTRKLIAYTLDCFLEICIGTIVLDELEKLLPRSSTKHLFKSFGSNGAHQ